jgi:phage terminase small subunit
MAEETIEEIELTAKQEKFCYEYCWDFNATQAAIRAGYSKKTAGVIGNENLNKPYLQSRIKQMQDNLAETAGISRLKVLREHQKMAFSSIAHLHMTWIKRKDFEDLTEDQKSCIAEIDTKIKTEFEFDPENPQDKKPITVEYVKIKLYDKQKSLDSISKMLGFDAPNKTELTGPNGKPFNPSVKIEIINSATQVKRDDPGTGDSGS